MDVLKDAAFGGLMVPVGELMMGVVGKWAVNVVVGLPPEASVVTVEAAMEVEVEVGGGNQL